MNSSDAKSIQDGFYWVKSNLGTWSIAERMGDQWGVIAFLDNQCDIDNEIEEIGERIEGSLPLKSARNAPMKLFEVLTTSVGESYVRSYAWCETREQAIEMFESANTGYSIAEVTELFDASRGPFISRPSDSGFSHSEAAKSS